MKRAVDSAIGLPRSSTSASRMLVFLMPPEVRRSFTCLLESVGKDVLGAAVSQRCRDPQMAANSSPCEHSGACGNTRAAETLDSRPALAVRRRVRFAGRDR